MKLLSMMSLGLAAVASLQAITTPTAVALEPAQQPEARTVQHKRVVVRLNVKTSGGYEYLYVDNEDGEPVVLDSFVAERGYLGVTLLELTPELRVHFGASASAGVMISKVDPDSPAHSCGVATGDVLVTIDDRPIDSSNRAARLIAAGKRGDRMALALLRDGQSQILTATLDRRQRKQLDLSGMMRGGAIQLPRGRTQWRSADPSDVPFVELNPESMGEALRIAREHLDSPEWRASLERHGQHRQEVEERIKELEQRLEELEKQLGDLPE